MNPIPIYITIGLAIAGIVLQPISAFEPKYTNYFSNPDYQLHSLEYGHYKYFIPYKITGGKLHDLKLDCNTASMLVYLIETTGGNLTLNIPRKILDAKLVSGEQTNEDYHFLVITDGEESEFKITESDADSRTLEIPFVKNAIMMEIIGTFPLNFSYESVCGAGDSYESPYYELLAPLKQFKSGILVGEIRCKEGLILAIKSFDGSPACVTPETKQKLIERGWAKYNSHNAIYDKSDFDRIQIENRGMENQTCFGIYSNETRVSIACDMVTHGSPPIPFKPETKIQCQGNKMCLTEVVTRIVDGDTIYITGGHKIRLSLTNTPEMYESGFYKATQFTENLCPVGSKVIVDQDDMQPYDAYDRLLGKVVCDGKILNAELLHNGHANILTQYCKTSEFSKEKWAQEFGCQ